MTLGSQINILRSMRLETGLSLSEVARRAGLNKGRLSILERGVPPTSAELEAILAVLRTARLEGEHA